MCPSGTSSAPPTSPGHSRYRFHREVAPGSIHDPRRQVQHRRHFTSLHWMGKSSTICNLQIYHHQMNNIARLNLSYNYGRIRLPVSTVNRTYDLSGINHVTLFRKYGKHSTGSSTYGPWVRTYSKLFSCKSVLTVCSYGAQSNEICTYGRVSRGSHPRVRRYGLLYLRTVEYDH